MPQQITGRKVLSPMSIAPQTHLGRLIEQQQKLEGLSYSAMAARAAARGEKLGKSNIGRMAGGESLSLGRATIFGLAAGLGVTPATVARAMLADMGIALTEPAPDDAAAAIASDPTLSERHRRQLLAALSALKQP